MRYIILCGANFLAHCVLCVDYSFAYSGFVCIVSLAELDLGLEVRGGREGMHRLGCRKEKLCRPR
jgi:hypothetical protein